MPLLHDATVQTDAVHGDRTFFGDVRGDFRRNFHAEPPVLLFGRCVCGSAFWHPLCDSANRIDVTLHDMAAEFLPRSERSFQIYACAGFYFREGCAAKSFGAKDQRKNIPRHVEQP